MDRARLCHVLTDQMGMEVNEIAERLAIEKDLVDETLSLLDLDLNIQDALSNGHITEPAAITLAQIEDPGVRQELFKYTVRYRWNPVRIDRALRARLEHQGE
jgi:hypothetical protein